MKKLQPILEVIHQVLVSQVQLQLSSVSDSALGLRTSVGSVALKTENAEGLTFEDIQVHLESLKPPTLEDPNLEVAVVLERLDLNIASVFWGRAAKLARQAIVGNLGLLLDRVELRGVRVQLSLSPARVADVRVSMESCLVKLMGITMNEVHGLELEVEGFDLQERNKKKALEAAQVRLNQLKIRVSERTMNRAVDVARDKIPRKAKLTSLDIALVERSMKVTVKTGYFPMAVPIEIQMATRDNLFGIYIVKVIVGLARPLILKAIQTFASGKPELQASGDHVWINPWVKIPVKIQTQVQRFGIAEGALVIEFGQSPTEVKRLVAAAKPDYAETGEEAYAETEEEGAEAAS